jgi:hypothetical protein
MNEAGAVKVLKLASSGELVSAMAAMVFPVKKSMC